MFSHLKNVWGNLAFLRSAKPNRDTSLPAVANTAWQERINRIRTVVYAHVHPDQEFRLILVSGDIADQIHLENLLDFDASPIHDAKFDTLTAVDGIPVKFDPLLPRGSVVFIPVETYRRRNETG